MERLKKYFSSGKYVSLYSLDETDIENTSWFDWFNDEKVCLFLQKHYKPNTKSDQIDFFKSIKNSKNDIIFGLVDTNNKLKGVCGIHEINYINRNCSISLVIGEKTDNNDFALEATHLILNHIFLTLNLNKVKMGNLKGLRSWFFKLNEAFCFEKEGILKKEVFKNGIYSDVIISALFKEDYISQMKLGKLDFIVINKFKYL